MSPTTRPARPLASPPLLPLLLLLLLGLLPIFFPHQTAAQVTIFHVTEGGSDESGVGSEIAPWASIGHALSQIPDEPNLIVLVHAGQYLVEGSGDAASGWTRAFDHRITIRSDRRYGARLMAPAAQSIHITGSGLSLGGFRFERRTLGAGPPLLELSGHDLRIADSLFGHPETASGSLVSIRDGAQNIHLESNLFGDPISGFDAIAIADARDIHIAGNILINESAADIDHATLIRAGLSPETPSRNLHIERNILIDRHLGSGNAPIAIGHAQHPPGTLSGQDIHIESNLLVSLASSRLGILELNGTEGVHLRANTIIGAFTYPAYSYTTFHELTLHNNIFTDPSGQTLLWEAFPPDRAVTVANNLYWRAGQPLPPDGLTTTDPTPHLLDPLLPNPSLQIPSAFPSPSELTPLPTLFIQLSALAATAPTSPAIDHADGNHMPLLDLSGRPRGIPDLGALEHRPSPLTPAPPPSATPHPFTIHLPNLHRS